MKTLKRVNDRLARQLRVARRNEQINELLVTIQDLTSEGLYSDGPTPIAEVTRARTALRAIELIVDREIEARQ